MNYYEQFVDQKNPNRINFGTINEPNILTQLTNTCEICELSNILNRKNVLHLKGEGNAIYEFTQIDLYSGTTYKMEFQIYLPTSDKNVTINGLDNNDDIIWSIKFKSDGTTYNYTPTTGDQNLSFAYPNKFINSFSSFYGHPYRTEMSLNGDTPIHVDNVSLSMRLSIANRYFEKIQIVLGVDAECYIDNFACSWIGSATFLNSIINISNTTWSPAFAYPTKINNQRNIIYYNNKYYYIPLNEAVVNSVENAYSVPVELINSYKIPNQVLGNRFGENMYFAASFDYAAASRFDLYQFKYEGSSWTVTHVAVSSSSDMRLLGIWKNTTSGNVEWITLTEESGTYYIRQHEYNSSISSFTIPISDMDHVFVGNNYNGDFYFAYWDGTYLQEVRLYGTNHSTTQLPDGFIAPTTWDINFQGYFNDIINNQIVFFTKNYLFLSINDEDFTNYEGSTNNHAVNITKNGYDDIIKYIAWGTRIWDKQNGGSIERIQKFETGAYSGSENIFIGDNCIYKIENTELQLNKGNITREVMKAPIATVFSSLEPFTDQFIKILDATEKLIFKGKITKSKNDFTQYQYTLKSGVEYDLKQKVDESYTSKSIPYIVKDIIDKYCNYIWHGEGTNGKVNEFTEDQIDGTDTDWSNSDTLTSTSSYLTEKVFLNGVMTDVLEQVNGTGLCSVIHNNQSFTVASGKFAMDDLSRLSRIYFYEGATILGQIALYSNNIIWINTAGNQTLQAAVANTIYHWACVFNASSNTVDIYINGAFDSTQNLNTTTPMSSEITSIYFNSDSGITAAYTIYNSQLYLGDSIDEAMNTYSSISPLNTDTFTKSFKNDVKDVFKWAAQYGGFVGTFRPNDQLYLGAFTPNAQNISESSETYGYDELSFEVFNEKYSLVKIIGGYSGGVRLTITIQGEPNFGYWQDTFANITNLTELTAIATQIINDKNVEIVACTLDLVNLATLDVGTYSLLTSITRSITNEPYHIISNTVNIKTGIQRLYLTDSFYLPQASKQEKIEENVSANEQNIGENANEIQAIKTYLGI